MEQIDERRDASSIEMLSRRNTWDITMDNVLSLKNPVIGLKGGLMCLAMLYITRACSFKNPQFDLENSRGNSCRRVLHLRRGEVHSLFLSFKLVI
jgi:hypothetical protein